MVDVLQTVEAEVESNHASLLTPHCTLQHRLVGGIHYIDALRRPSDILKVQHDVGSILALYHV